jgi:hypothetical protein
MEVRISELSKLYLWTLLLQGGQGFESELKIDLSPEESTALVDQGLLEQLQSPLPGRDAVGVYHQLTDRARSWLMEQMPVGMGSASEPTERLLTLFMKRLHGYLQTNGLSLSDWANACEFELTSDRAQTSDWEGLALELPLEDLEVESGRTETCIQARIRDAYLKLADGEYNVPVRLAALRQALHDVSRAELDAALMVMELDASAWFATFEDPTQRGIDDLNALLDVSGIDRDLVYLENH